MAGILKNKPFMALAVLVIVGLPLAYFFAIKPRMASGSPATPEAHATAPATAAAALGQHMGPTYTVTERVVNLQGGAGGRYLRLEVVLEFEPEDPKFYTLTGEAHKKAQEKFLEEIEPKAPAIQDAVLALVSSKSADQILTPAGRERLKDEIASAVVQRIGHPKVVNVYFTQFVAQ